MDTKTNKFLFEPLKLVRRSVILDTDIGPDCDDVGAMALLYASAKKYNTNVLGVVSCSSNQYAPGCIDAINKFCGYPDVPVGTYKKGSVLEEDTKYNRYIAENFSESFANGTLTVHDSVSLYRSLLANSQNNSIIIITIGTLNNIAALIESKPDSISPFSGFDLVKNKVYCIVSMAGFFPSGREFNIVCDGNSAKKVFESKIVPIIFSGFEIGESIKTGFKGLEDSKYKDNPLYLAYKLYTGGGMENASFDLTAVQFAFEGEGENYYLSSPGQMSVDTDNNDTNSFVPDENGNQYHMIKRISDIEIAHGLNNILQSF